MRLGVAANRPGSGDGEGRGGGRLRHGPAVGTEEHVAACAGRRRLAEVERLDGAVRAPRNEESAPREIARLRVDDGEGESRRDRGVHRIPSGGEDLCAGPRGFGRRRDDHPSRRGEDASRAEGRGVARRGKPGPAAEYRDEERGKKQEGASGA